MNKKLIGGIVSGVLVGGALILGVMSLTKIPAGYVGVQYDMNGGVRDEILSQGFHFVNPMVSVTKYSISSESAIISKLKYVLLQKSLLMEGSWADSL